MHWQFNCVNAVIEGSSSILPCSMEGFLRFCEDASFADLCADAGTAVEKDEGDGPGATHDVKVKKRNK